MRSKVVKDGGLVESQPQCRFKVFGVDENVATSTSEPAIIHLPQAGSDPELFLQREHTMSKAASKLAAAPSTPPTRISET